MFKGTFVLGLIMMVNESSGQVVNHGNMLIQPGVYVKCLGNLANGSGTITNDGRIEVQGDFTNRGTYISAGGDDSLIMFGGGNVVLSTGGAILSSLTINKLSNADKVTLNGMATVNKSLDYLQGILSTDYLVNPSFMLSAPISAIFNFAPGREILGRVKRTGWQNGSSVSFNSPQLQITTNGGTSPTDITVTMLPQAFGGDPSQLEREVKRKFLFTQNGGSNFTADVQFPYLSDELNNNTSSDLVPWSLIGAEWTARLTPVTRDEVNKSVTATGIPASVFAKEWKLADPRYIFNITVFLKGAWNNPSGLMRTTLNTNGLLPLSQPYNKPPYNYAGPELVLSIPNTNIVDWLLVELRKPSTGLPGDADASTIIGRKAGFLLNNGTITDLDGATPLFFDIAKQGTGNYIVVRHRNHLAVMSNMKASNGEATFTNDFSVYGNNYERTGATSPPAVLLALTGAGSTKYGLWPGDVNSNGSVTASDITPINVAIAGPATGNTNTYNPRDANLDRNVTSADVSVTNTSIAALAVTNSSLIAANNKRSEKQSHVPGEGSKQ